MGPMRELWKAAVCRAGLSGPGSLATGGNTSRCANEPAAIKTLGRQAGLPGWLKF